MTKSFLTKLRQASKLLFRSKFMFRKPRNVTLLFFGTPNNTALLEKVFDENYAIIDPTYESTVHAWDICTALMKKPFRKATMTALYFESFLRRLRPAKVVTFTDNHSDFYMVRNTVEDLEARFFVFQNGVRLVNLEWPNRHLLKPGDAAFLLTEDYANYFRRNVAGGAKARATGKLLSNPITTRSEPDHQKPTKAAIISQWEPGWEIQVAVSTRVSAEHFYKPEMDMAPNIFSAAKELGIEVEILGRASAQNQEGEQAFFTNCLGTEDWRYCAKPSHEGNTKRLAEYDLFFCFDSTLGYELCALKMKCLFLDIADNPFRMSLGQLDEDRLIDSKLLLKTEELSQWPQKINKILEMSEEEYSEEAKRVVGQGPMNWTIEDYRQALK